MTIATLNGSMSVGSGRSLWRRLGHAACAVVWGARAAGTACRKAQAARQYAWHAGRLEFGVRSDIGLLPDMRRPARRDSY